MRFASSMAMVVAVVAVLGTAPGSAGPASPAQRLKVKSVTLGIGNRVFTDFYEEVTTRLDQEFRVGDSEFTARVTEFVPDFMLDMKTRKVLSRSNETNNPAFHVLVRKGGAPNDTTWAFLNMPPHFGRHSMLAFKILKVEFENHPPIVARPDSTAATSPGKQP